MEVLRQYELLHVLHVHFLSWILNRIGTVSSGHYREGVLRN